jgi:hypothetical protein
LPGITPSASCQVEESPHKQDADADGNQKHAEPTILLKPFHGINHE